MIKWICPIIPLLLVFTACNNTAKNKEGKTVIGDTAHYYPLSTYLQEQISENDLRNLPRTLRYRNNDQTSQQLLNRDSFLLLTNLFTDACDYFSKHKYLFSETVMHDLSTQSYTLSYRPFQTEKAELTYVDILLSENSQLVKRIDIRRSRQKMNEIINEHLSWRTDKGFLITRETETTDSSRHSNEVIDVSWEPEKQLPL
jgi:hypothetical protein